LYNSVIPSFTEPVFVSSKTISYKETHHFNQNKMLKIKKINLKHRKAEPVLLNFGGNLINK
jgi:hypothetical protein